MRTKVGLLTTRVSTMPSPSATARTKWVLPAPSGPTRAITAPGNSRPPSRRPSASVAARSGASAVHVAIGRSSSSRRPALPPYQHLAPPWHNRVVTTTPLLQLTEAGLYCPAGDFHVDPWRPVDRAVITHAHSDHARRGSRYYLAARPGQRLLRTRLGDDAAIDAIDYGEAVDVGSV